MPPRTPRTPPNRSRSRRPGVPSVASLKSPASLSYDREVMKIPRTPNVAAPLQSAPARAKAAMTETHEHAIAMDALHDGDSSILMPYQPTPSINPPRPRTTAAGYDSKSKILTVEYRDGGTYEYYDVPANVWRNFKRVKSPGRLINRAIKGVYEFDKIMP